MTRVLQLNAFDMACIGHIQQGMWTHPRDSTVQYNRLDYWVGLARTLERGLFDGLFLADVLGIYDVYGDSPDAALRGAVQVPLLDPALLVPAMAAATQHLGFGITCNLAYEQPFLFARRMSTLDHLTQGRIGWNIVTGYLDSAARAMGFSQQMAHDDRYDLADEYMDVVYRLWEASWDGDAVRADRGQGVYADPAKVRAVRHAGRQYQMEAIHLCEPSPQRTPVLYQAGTSDRGRRFAASHAECVFVNGGKPEPVAKLVADLRARARGRPLKVFAGATVVVGRTEAEARALLEEYRRHASVEAALAHASASLGIDFSRYEMDEPIESGPGQAIQSNVAAMKQAAGPVFTKRRLIDQFVLGSRQPPIVGSAAQVAEALIGWAEAADVDGFNLSRTVMPEGLERFVDLVVPELQARGAFKTAYAPGTYREKLFGGGALLAAPHPAAGLRASA
ncbi:N5,N10-methylene tetrahydromethanopterin reductase [Pseudoroseomonas deserti]|uniref:N5,N10-methylene tetrahydromethanopterin reductase n=1 Tax=Teichococcus deserti TaxID=1817963 RepID=A0A1V2H2Q8_9PROT|nr:LLM class flavin-dependent oxidoreductase [Pseudoroseomonas deserti]ONG53361.1 N5,N10-methylene tetrahydromethanopterin reductase [Pseudoroseomonas deserti]